MFKTVMAALAFFALAAFATPAHASSVSFQANGSDVVDLVLTPADFADGVFCADPVTVQNANSWQVDFTYKDLDPDSTGSGFRLQGVIEGEEAPGVFVPMINQYNPHFYSGNSRHSALDRFCERSQISRGSGIYHP